MQLHKCHTNSELLQDLCENNVVIFIGTSKTFTTENLSYKVLGIAKNSLDDLLYFDTHELVKFSFKTIDTKRYILLVYCRVLDPIGF